MGFSFSACPQPPLLSQWSPGNEGWRAVNKGPGETNNVHSIIPQYLFWLGQREICVEGGNVGLAVGCELWLAEYNE